MIDHSSLHALLLQAATGTVESSQAMSLGLVTTELVINALKHAFPPGHEGEIVVRYDVDGAGSRFSVSDNSVGRRDNGPAGGGLGTSSTPVPRCPLARRVRSC